MSPIINGTKIPEYLLGSLHETILNQSEAIDLRNALEKDGYLFLRNVIGKDEIAKAREDIFQKLGEVGELEYPFFNGIASGKSKRDTLNLNRGQFWEQVSNTTSLRNITNGQTLKKVFDKIFGTPAVGFDFIFLRAVASGKFTHMHCDAGFFTRKTEKILTCWVAFTDVSFDKGPLFIIEGSHRFKDIYKKYNGFDIVLNKNIKATIDKHPVAFAKERNSKILTAEFKPGDILVFGMYTVHGTFENNAQDKKIRLTCDIRFQPMSEPKDPRYFGPNPVGTTGAGYGELNSARPLNEDWHIR